MALYNDISLLDKYDPMRDPNLDYGGIARGTAGKLLGNAADVVGTVIKSEADKAKKAKIDKFLVESRSKTGPFAGMTDAQATERLSQLLYPLDEELSKRYAVRADELKREELRLAKELTAEEKTANRLAESRQYEEKEWDRRQSVKGVRNIDDEIKKLTFSINALGDSVAEVATKKALREKLNNLLQEQFAAEKPAEVPVTAPVLGKTMAKPDAPINELWGSYTPVAGSAPEAVPAPETKPAPPVVSPTEAAAAIVNKYKGKSQQDLLGAQLEIKKLVRENPELADVEQNLMASLADQHKKNQPPAPTKRPATTSADLKAGLQAALGKLMTASLVSTRGDRNNPTGKQMIFKVGQRALIPEAVNEGDVQNASGLWQKLGAKLGAPVTFSEDQIDQSIEIIRGDYDQARAELEALMSDEYKKGLSETSLANIKRALSTYKLGNFGGSAKSPEQKRQEAKMGTGTKEIKLEDN